MRSLGSFLGLVGSMCCLGLLAPGPLHAVPPGEVTDLRWDDAQTLVWEGAPLADHYNVYRGYLQDLAPDFFGTALDAELTATSLQDPTIPSHAWGFFYVVTAANDDGEGTMGSARPNNYPWPGFGVAGRWEGLRPWPGVAIHAALLHTGRVITWQGGTPTQTFIWDPVSDTFEVRAAPADLFCAGHSFLPDGRLLAIGGTINCCPPALGGNWTGLFDPVVVDWQEGPFMAVGRWYPTSLSLGDGRALAFSGLDQLGQNNPLVEAYSISARPGGIGEWQILPEASATLPLFPRTHLLTTGKVFLSGPGTAAFTLDPLTESWEFIAQSDYGFRGEGSSVLLPPSEDRVMIVGGRQGNDEGDSGLNFATNTAEVIDLSSPAPNWSYTGSMRFPRMHANLVILPTGEILAAGGGYNDAVSTYPSEIYDPADGTWTVAATMRSFRLYHSTAILLPDGRVLWAGSNSNSTAEFYSPGYLFRGPRPMIDSAPEVILYNHSFAVETTDPSSIASVVLLRPGATTHSVNMEQRLVSLGFTAGPGALTVTAPASPNLVPPGYYMLFLVDDDEVPSEAVFIKVR